MEATSRLRGDPWGVAVVVDASGRLRGTITDYDIRHALLDRVALESPVADVMPARPVVATTAATDKQIPALLQTPRVRALPVVA